MSTLQNIVSPGKGSGYVCGGMSGLSWVMWWGPVHREQHHSLSVGLTCIRVAIVTWVRSIYAFISEALYCMTSCFRLLPWYSNSHGFPLGIVNWVNTFSLQIDVVKIHFIILTRNKIRADIDSFSPVSIAFSFFRMLKNTFLLFKNNSVYGKLFWKAGWTSVALSFISG